jgi:hypothetical protein
VEGETTPQFPATGRLDAAPDVVHFRTRLRGGATCDCIG